MKKHLYLIALIICLILSACGTQPPTASSFETDSITVYDINTFNSGVIIDEAIISDIATSAQIENWKELTEPYEQVSAVPDYALDFGNGTVIGLLGDGYIMVGTEFEYLSEVHQSFRFDGESQYQVPVEFTALLKEITVNAAAMEEIPTEPEEISVPIPEDNVSIPVDSPMTEFMNGALEGVQFGDDSEAAKNFQTWYDLLGGECVPSEASSPQEYWGIWSEHVERLYTANSYEFLVEQDYPISAKYIELKYGIDG